MEAPMQYDYDIYVRFRMNANASLVDQACCSTVRDQLVRDYKVYFGEQYEVTWKYAPGGKKEYD